MAIQFNRGIATIVENDPDISKTGKKYNLPSAYYNEAPRRKYNLPSAYDESKPHKQ